MKHYKQSKANQRSQTNWGPSKVRMVENQLCLEIQHAGSPKARMVQNQMGLITVDYRRLGLLALFWKLLIATPNGSKPNELTRIGIRIEIGTGLLTNGVFVPWRAQRYKQRPFGTLAMVGISEGELYFVEKLFKFFCHFRIKNSWDRLQLRIYEQNQPNNDRWDRFRANVIR